MDARHGLIRIINYLGCFSQVHSTTDGDGLGSKMEKEFYKEIYRQINDSNY